MYSLFVIRLKTANNPVCKFKTLKVRNMSFFRALSALRFKSALSAYEPTMVLTAFAIKFMIFITLFRLPLPLL